MKVEDLEKMQNGDNASYFVISNGHQAYINQIKKLAAGVKNIFLLTMDQVAQIGEFAKVVEGKFEGCNIVLWKKKVRLFFLEEKVFGCSILV